MHQGLTLGSWRWLAPVALLFCLPLFIGLGRSDLETDEAIYSFAVDRILEAGDWLQPRSSPSESSVFLEKPPLKFWIVAAAIGSGLLPHDEFGLRFWDALCGGAGFLYVFAIGALMAGPLCGAIAVLLVFVHWPLVLEHGLRTNNMEAPLFLCYCGGIYHFLRYHHAARGQAIGQRRRLHAAAVGLYFTLGFMTKFVAALFLPAVLGLATLLLPAPRRTVIRDWRLWSGVAALVAILCAPWFVYAQIEFGRRLWDTMLAAHVYTRFTSYLDPAHVRPWNFYFVTLYERLADSESAGVVGLGLAALLIQTVRRRWLEGTVVLLWAFLPLTTMSLATSKLYHYVYPFLPPLTIAAAYFLVLVLMLARAPVKRGLERAETLMAARFPRLSASTSGLWARRTATIAIWIAVMLAVTAVVFGEVRLVLGQKVIFKSAGTLRPAIAIMVAAVLGHRTARVAPIVVAVAVLGAIPIWHYIDTFPRLLEQRHPLRTLSECVGRVEARVAGAAAPGMYVDAPDESIQHPIYYYFRRVRPWTRQETPSAGAFYRHIDDSTRWGPVLVRDSRYDKYLLEGHEPFPSRSVAVVQLLDYRLLLPGPYTSCASLPNGDGLR